MKKKIPTICKTISILLFVAFAVLSIIDYINYNSICTSAPYYVNLLVNALYLLTPAIASYIIGIIVEKSINKSH